MEIVKKQNGVGVTYKKNGKTLFTPQNLGEKFCTSLQNILQKEGTPTQYGAIYIEAQKGLENVIGVYGERAIIAMSLVAGSNFVEEEAEEVATTEEKPKKEPKKA